MNRISYHNLKKYPGPNNALTSDWGIPAFGNYTCISRGNRLIWAHRCDLLLLRRRRKLRPCASLQSGFGCIQPYVTEPNERIHLFGHSLGVTVIHDFLFGSSKWGMYPFRQKLSGRCLGERRTSNGATRHNGELTLGGLASAASQLPLMVMRKQVMVDKLFNHEGLDPADIGIVSTAYNGNFYDIDDLLGFASSQSLQPKPSDHGHPSRLWRSTAKCPRRLLGK